MGHLDQKLADAVYADITENVTVDHEGWAYDVTHRVAERLQRDVPADERLEPVVAWLEERSAFTMPGRYVYFSRYLLQRGLTEDAVAFIFAHELAHHRLGHVNSWLEDVPAAWVVGLVAHVMKRIVCSPEREADADRWALERCVAAGYDRERCLDAFRAMERAQLDLGDVEGVFGADDREPPAAPSIDGEAPGPLAEIVADGRRWLWQRRRGYASTRDRRAALDRVEGDLSGRSAR